MKGKSASQSVLIGLIVAITLAVSTSPARAQFSNTHWTAAGAGDWFVSGNWDNGVPDNSKYAFVNNGGKPQIGPSPTPATAYWLTLGQYCADSGSLRVDGTNAALNVYVNCKDDDYGRLYVGKQGSGTLTIANGAQVHCGVGYIGALSCELTPSSGAVTVDGTNSYWGIFGCAPQLFVGGNENGPGGTGLLTATNGGTVDVGDLIHVYSSGTLTGNGTIAAINGTTVDGTLAPNWTLTVNGGLTFSGTAPLMQCNVTPANLGSVDVEVTGTATLTGRLSVTMTGTFTTPADFHLLHASTLLDRFSSYSFTYTGCLSPSIIYHYDTGYVDLHVESSCQ